MSSGSVQAATVRRVIVSVEATQPALVFYRGVLGLTVARQGGDFTSLSSGDGLEILLHRRSVDVSGPAVSLGFAVADLEATVSAWTALGGVVIDPPEQQPWGERMAVVRDPDGHVVCISQA